MSIAIEAHYIMISLPFTSVDKANLSKGINTFLGQCWGKGNRDTIVGVYTLPREGMGIGRRKKEFRQDTV